MQQPTLTDTAELAKELDELAGREELALRSAELQGLAADLRAGNRLAEWAELDLVAAFARPESLAAPAPVTSREGLLRRLVRVVRGRAWRGRTPREVLNAAVAGARRVRVRDELLEAALGVLVFVPLLVTWFGLREASRAYHELSEEDPEQATRPFLQLWQSGFGGRVSALGRFDNVALMAVLLIALIVLTAVWHARVRGRADRERAERETEREHLLGRLTSVLTRTQLALADQRLAAPMRFTGELAKAAGKLETLLRKATDGQRALSRAADATQRATDGLGTAADRLSAAVAPLGAATARLEAAVQAGQAENARLASANAAEVRGVGDRITGMGRQIETALNELTTVQRELLTTSRDVVAATDRAAEAVVQSAEATDEAVRGMRDATDRWDAAAAHWENAAHQVEEKTRNLTGYAPGFVGVPGPQGPVR
ncbi:hypothetical protein [Streptomyces litchfieldiae]|uniref:Uncharacterized protein n=1 Tax=Streptomyces litchfieldiae TaxID=3075543 RepID=A0ABU2MUG8_9ACTN|nr:hypothetical protein [Streptomyces sp. DSM 44938]MDT0345291.1 hypothetical protein [Streptomyces sp. DSM 44938]